MDVILLCHPSSNVTGTGRERKFYFSAIREAVWGLEYCMAVY